MSTVFDPKNKAVTVLHRKPHLGTVEDRIEILSDLEYDERSRKNIARWISAHVILSHPMELVGSRHALRIIDTLRVQRRGREDIQTRTLYVGTWRKDSPARRGKPVIPS
ncbi:hypothetical protein RSAG8_07678, partial [Rhizoctonia solani AG-8 WAC10335]